MTAPLRVVVMGAGGIGAYAGARLANAGADVAFVARGAHLAALRRDGLTVHSALGDVRVPRVVATDVPASLPVPDLILFTVKGGDNSGAIAAIAPVVGPRTAVLSFQNGVDGLDALIEHFGAERVLAGVTYVPAEIEAPGIIRHIGRVNRFVFGEASGGASPRCEAIAALGRAGGLDLVVADDAMAAVWAKFVMLAPFAALCSLTRLALGRWIAVPETRDLYRRGMEEVAAIAAARGVRLPPDTVAKNLDFALHTADPATRGSMLSDLERGKPIELDTLLGAVERLGRAHGVPTPFASFAYAALKPHANGHAQLA